MVIKSMLMKQKWYPRPHHKEYSTRHSMDSATANQTCIFPIAAYDEGLGTASDYEANPNHASFLESSQPNCYPDSFLNGINMEVTFSLTKQFYEGDALYQLRAAFMMINTSFLEDYTALDEISTLDISEVLELQTEGTDRQGFPLYNSIDMFESFTGSANVPTGTQGVTGIIEAVAFNALNYYDNLHYFTTAGKLKHVQRGLKWFNLNRQHPIKKFRLYFGGKSKRMVPYSFTGMMVHVPSASTKDQFHDLTETNNNIKHMQTDFKYRYNEWNQDFNMKLV